MFRSVRGRKTTHGSEHQMPLGLLKENLSFTRVELQEVFNEEDCGHIYYLE